MKRRKGDFWVVIEGWWDWPKEIWNWCEEVAGVVLVWRWLAARVLRCVPELVASVPGVREPVEVLAVPEGILEAWLLVATCPCPSSRDRNGADEEYQLYQL